MRMFKQLDSWNAWYKIDRLLLEKIALSPPIVGNVRLGEGIKIPKTQVEEMNDLLD